MRTIMDCHFAALIHFLHRIVSEDAWDGHGLAPSFEDYMLAERYIAMY
jgi:hypothetical protein